jgi:hypothetical protein
LISVNGVNSKQIQKDAEHKDLVQLICRTIQVSCNIVKDLNYKLSI